MPDPTTLSRSLDVEAPADLVWRLISDLPRMGDLSPENAGGSWQGGATGPAVGARFRGANRRGWRRWSTTATVTTSEPGRSFAFDVSSLGLAVARWSYQVEAQGVSRCRVTESWLDRRGRAIHAIGRLATGVADRVEYTAVSIEQTLQALKATAEAAAPS